MTSVISGNQPRGRGRPRKSPIAIAKPAETWFLYGVKMHVPDPRKDDTYFTYDGTVSRDRMIANGPEFEQLQRGFADEILRQDKVVVRHNDVVVTRLEFLKQTDGISSGEPD